MISETAPHVSSISSSSATASHPQKYVLTPPQASILLSVYEEPKRPYSQAELRHLRQTLREKLNLAPETVTRYCGHKYLPKRNYHGSNCSVCYKLSYTPPELLNIADNLVDVYMKQVMGEPPATASACVTSVTTSTTPSSANFTYNLYDLEKTFYTWLYKERYHNP